MNRKLFLILIFIGVFLSACGHAEKLKQSNEIIGKIERFRSETGGLPNNLSEIGIVETESGPVFYEKKSDTNYKIWFGKELGESATYDSQTKKWNNL